MLTIAALAAGQSAWAWDGSGTESSPYLIRTTDDLVTLSTGSQNNNYAGVHFRLMTDLDMSGVSIGTIGINGMSFGGTFDGNGHAIRNLTINKPDDMYVGLFGYVAKGFTVKNLIIDGADILGNNMCGILVGYEVSACTIENCLVVNSSICGSYTQYIGIIAGTNKNTILSGNYYYNCSVTKGDDAPVTTNIGIKSADLDGAKHATATVPVTLPDAWVEFDANQCVSGGIYYDDIVYTDDASDVTIGPTTWAALQMMLSNASTDADNPTGITLAADITATGRDAYLDLPYGHHVILDLNGHTIDRALTVGTDNGYVLKVNSNSTLTIRDSAGGGTITGGWNTNGPGCITVYSSATLRLESGTISGNRVNMQGGSAISSSGTVYITGGTISDNWSNITGNNYNMCGTFYFSSGGTLYMSGGAIIGNRCHTTTYGAAGIGVYLGMGDPNIHLSGTYNISGNMQGDYNEQNGEWSNLTPSDILNTGRLTYHIDVPISPTAPAAMILNNGVGGHKATFTSGWDTYMSGEDPENYFILAIPNGQGMGLNASDEVTIGTLHTIALADGITASATQAAAGRPVTLGYTGEVPVSHYVVYSVNGSPISGNSFTMPASNVTVTANLVRLHIILDENETGNVLSTLCSTYQGKQVEVSFSRQFSAGKASTICLPFPMTSISGGKVYEFQDVTYNSSEGWVATMVDATPNMVTETVANTPYLFLPDDDGNVTFSGTIDNVPASVTAGTTESGDWTFHGTYSRLDYGTAPFSGAVFGFAATGGKASDGQTDVTAGQFIKAADGAFIQPFRAYLTYSGSNSALQAPSRQVQSDVMPDRITVRLIGNGGGTTAVGTIDTATGEVTIDRWFHINGEPVEGTPLTPGLYLNSDGRKVLISE